MVWENSMRNPAQHHFFPSSLSLSSSSNHDIPRNLEFYTYKMRACSLILNMHHMFVLFAFISLSLSLSLSPFFRLKAQHGKSGHCWQLFYSIFFTLFVCCFPYLFGFALNFTLLLAYCPKSSLPSSLLRNSIEILFRKRKNFNVLRHTKLWSSKQHSKRDT